ncbi:hypothetical protein H1P_1230010 [Hyella patelloides LEGE 07179]|uniref:Uncharacterized protein n=1 Tax=Hyella patelloides LEGE 07179 TaxID=945734 RepID=A0A563VKA6_9CYAN|nr:hypothetical protein H1P_1230010 [Hyella patelloides LEGE 07179]
MMPDLPQSVAKAHKLISEPENYPGLKSLRDSYKLSAISY